jgi:uncharacterized delta-60 repeat protein
MRQSGPAVVESLECRRLLAGGPSFGDLDYSYGDHGRVILRDDVAYAFDQAGDFLVQPDGKVLIGATSDANDTFRVYRLNADGTADRSFNPNQYIEFSRGVDVASIARQADGKILVAGSMFPDEFNPDSPHAFALARFNADGTPDKSFGVGGAVVTSFDVAVRGVSVAVASGGRIVVAGETAPGNYEIPRDLAVAVYKAEGKPDASFDGDGKRLIDVASTDDRLFGMTVQPSGKIVLGVGCQSLDASGSGVNPRLGVVRLNANGALDGSFGVGGKSVVAAPVGADFDYHGGFAVRPDGKVVLATSAEIDPSADSYEYGVSFARFTPDGKVDLAPTKPQGGDGSSILQHIALRPDGNVYVLQTYDVELFSANGAALGSAATTPYDSSHIAVQSDGKFLVLGTATTEDYYGEDRDEFYHDVIVSRFVGQSGAEVSFGRATWNDLAFDGAGRLYAAWYDPDAHVLKYAVRDKAHVWSAVHVLDADSADVGSFVSLALDRQGLPSVAYQDTANADLKYAHFNGRRWVRQTVDAKGNTGLYPSLAFDAKGNAAISYYDKKRGDLRFAAATGTGAWAIGTVDADGDAGRSSQLRLNPATGGWSIAYEQSSTGQVRYAARGKSKWSVAVVADVGERALDLAFGYDPAGRARIAFYDSYEAQLLLATSGRRGRWSIEGISGSDRAVGRYANILFDDNGDPDLVFYDETLDALAQGVKGDGDYAGEWVQHPISGNPGGTYATAIGKGARKALAWIDEAGNLIVQAP